MHAYSVGQLYHPNVTRWPETVEFNYISGAYELKLFLARPDPEEIEAVKAGTAEFALLVEGDFLFLLSRFGVGGKGVPWCDAGYSWWLVPEDKRTLPDPEPTPENRVLLQVLLVDAATGILRVLRAVTLSPQFSRAMNAAIRAQAVGTPVNEKRRAQALSAIYARYPNSEAMVRAATARCVGGE